MRRTLLLLLLLALLAAARAAVPDLRLAAGRALPFAVEPHPLRLSALSAADQLADEPFPTGAWWTNLVLQPGDAPVVPMPYALRVVGHRAHVSFPFRVVTPTVIQSGFIAQIVLAAADDQGGEPSNHQVVGFDSFGVRLRFDSDRQQLFTLLLVRGSPYLTMEFAGSRPVLQATDGLSLVRLKRHDRLVFMDGSDVEFAVYSIQVSNGQMWYVFASDPEIDLQLGADGRVQASQPFTGALRVALSLEATTMPYLLESASVYPVGAQVNFSVDARDEASLDFRWKTKSFAAFAPDTDSSSRRQAQLLMLALPHHIDTMEIQTPNEDKTLANKVINTLRYSSIRGLMKGVLGSVWYMREQLLPVEWNFKDQGLFSDEYNVKEIGASSVDEERRKRLAMRAEAKEKIIASLQQDISTYPMLMGDDSYNFGKQIARETRLLLLADKFGQQEVVDHQLKKIKDGILPWLDGTNPDKFVYDETFGGLVTSFGLHNQDADYGNGYYNDHHFHYGYFMYALAVVRKYDPDFVTKNALPIAMLLADIGTPLDAQVPFFADLPANRFFPIARHKDWFVGHSYASGLFTMQDGKSQESSSECVNAYYAMTLFSSLDDNAASKNSYHQYARLMLAMEIRSTKKYWHMKKNSQIYEPIFSKNAMVGVVGEMSVVYSTWFGDSPVYVHGINLLPFTPITPHLIDEAYVVDEYPLIAGYLDSLQSRDIWRSIVVLDHAILDAEAAWDELTNSVEAYDTWNSPSNSMYWVATRPSWFSQKNRKILTQPKLNENDMCFGYPACSTAGDNGTALLCCSTLPGCCPSNLGCCPKEDTDSLPPNSCFGEHQCGVLGLGCCNSIDGCCEPDPITGAVLGCCKNQHPVTRTPKSTTTPAANGTRALCHNEPQCSAAGLDCCATPGGCCSGPGPKLDCCSADITSASTATSGSDGSSACHSQPTCAAANLDCCATAGGCCEPDPVSGAVLDCCIAETSAPAPPDLACHGEPVCAAAGVDCCATAEGCCQPDPVTGALLDCCSAFAAGSSSAATGGAGTNANGSSKTLARMFVGVAILGAVGLVAYALVTCYRRRGYTSVDRDMRALYCAGLMVAVIAFFVFLIVMA